MYRKRIRAWGLAGCRSELSKAYRSTRCATRQSEALRGGCNYLAHRYRASVNIALSPLGPRHSLQATDPDNHHIYQGVSSLCVSAHHGRLSVALIAVYVIDRVCNGTRQVVSSFDATRTPGRELSHSPGCCWVCRGHASNAAEPRDRNTKYTLSRPTLAISWTQSRVPAAANAVDFLVEAGAIRPPSERV